MSIERSYKGLPHRSKLVIDGLCKFFVYPLEDGVDPFGHVHLPYLVGLFQLSLFKFDDKFLVHSKDSNLEIRVRKFCYCSHVFSSVFKTNLGIIYLMDFPQTAVQKKCGIPQWKSASQNPFGYDYFMLDWEL